MFRLALQVVLLIFGILVTGNLLRALWHARRNPEEYGPEENDRDHTVW